MRSSYSIQLVLLSYAVAVLASHVTLNLAQRLRPIDRSGHVHRALYWPWIIGGAFAMGTGIWSMHFIGMLAFHLPIQVAYDLPLTTASYAIAVVVSGFALHRFRRNDTTLRGIALPGVVIGFGIAAMHYTGMAAMRMSPRIDYDPLLFATSVLIAIGAAVAALWIAFSLPQGQHGKSWHKLAAASVMGAAIVGMHYTGMAAAHFAPNAMCISSGPRLDATWLAITISTFTFLILGSTLLLSVIDGQLQSTIAHSAEVLRIANEKLEQHVLERTAQLESVNRTLQAEVGVRRQTEQSLRDSQQLLQAIVDNSQAVVYVKDLRGRYLLVNRRYEEIFRRGRDAILGQTDHDLFAKEAADTFRDMDVRAAAADQALTEEESVPQADGPHTYISVKAPLRDAAGKVYGTFGISTDITDRKVAEDQLREADRRKSEFLAILSHELRNPLAPLRNGLQILKLRSDTDPTVSQSVSMMDRQMTHLVRLVDDLLDVSRITCGRLELRRQKVLLTEVLANAVDASRVSIESRRHELIIDIRAQNLLVDGDSDRLAQVFSNLLLNAAKYTDAGGRIALSLDRQNGEAVVVVQDNGIGIPPPALERVFDMFCRLGSHELGGTEGLGIGLSLVRTLVQMHCGTVQALSEGPGRGSRFTVRLPLAEGSVAAADSAPRPAAQNRGQRVLVVDDNSDSAASLALLLEMEDYEVRTAADGEEAIEQVQAFEPQIVFMDLAMPRLNGVEAARRIRALPAGQSVRVVALTGWGQEADRQRTREAGMDHHLVKPISLDALRSVLGELDPGVNRRLVIKA